MLKTISFAVLGILAAFAIYVAMLPSAFRVVRSGKIDAPPAQVFAQVNDLHKWQAWSPWAKLDPKAVNTFEGPASGQGAAFSWSGNKEVGAGKMTIVESTPNDSIKFRLDFSAPMQATNTTVFTFKPDGNGTAVTWDMSGNNSFIGRAVCVFMDMDKMVGGMFETGLGNLNKVVGPPAKS
jgi:uncharacterized protein YndB with AHSA1/START domain